MQMHSKDFPQRDVESTPFFQALSLDPLPVRTIGRKRIRNAIVESTSEGIAEAEWEDLKGRYRCGEETAPEAEIEDCPPVCRVGARWGGGGHEMKRFTEIGRVLLKVHESTIERLVGFAYARHTAKGEGIRLSVDERTREE